MPKKLKKLTTTSYVLLGQLMARPWSAYELTQYLQLSLIREIWPRADSHIYDEVKNLAAHGLATVSEEANGGRKRKVYAITDAGRDAFQEWLRQPGGQRHFEWEKLTKVWFGDHVEKEELLALISEVREEQLAQVENWMEKIPVREIRDLHDQLVLPHRGHIGGLMGVLITRIYKTIVDWTDWAEEQVEEWPSTKQSAITIASHEVMTREMLESRERLVARATAEGAG